LLSSSSRYLRFLPTIQRYAIAKLLWLETNPSSAKLTISSCGF
jgi:hypothetical protein